MKTRLKLNWLIVMVIALAGLLPTAQAFYAPAAQRWLNRDPLGEPGFEAVNNYQNYDSPDEHNLYVFVANNPQNRIDHFGLKDWGHLFEVFEETTEKGLPGGEFAAALRVFGACNDIGLALKYAKQKYDDCMCDAITGDAKSNAGAEKECEKKWGKKVDKLQKIYEKNCKGKK